MGLGTLAYLMVEKLKSQIGTGGVSTTIVKQTVDNSVTGTLTQTVLCSLLIPSGSVGANDILFIEWAGGRNSSGTSAVTWNFYLGPTNNSIVGATGIANDSSSSTQQSFSGHRTVALKNSLTSQTVLLVAGNVNSPWAEATAARTSMSQNFNNNIYLIITATLANTGDTATLDWVYINKLTT
jgi:hypothetical protein